MPEDSQYDRNMKHVLTGIIQFVVVDSSAYVSFNKSYAEEQWQRNVVTYYSHCYKQNHFAERTLHLFAVLWDA
jgi:hypothetical protein